MGRWEKEGRMGDYYWRMENGFTDEGNSFRDHVINGIVGCHTRGNDHWKDGICHLKYTRTRNSRGENRHTRKTCTQFGNSRGVAYTFLRGFWRNTDKIF